MTPDLVWMKMARTEMYEAMTSEENITKNALFHRPETCSAREMTAPSSARPFQYSSSQTSAREDSWVVNGVSTTGTRWSCSWF